MAGNLTKIRIGSHLVGLVGLTDAFEEVRSRGISCDEERIQFLMRRVRAKNYVPPGSEEKYGRSLLRELKIYLEEEVELQADPGVLLIQIAGPGCPQCQSAEAAVLGILDEMDMAAEVIHVSDPEEITRLEVDATPCLLINGEPVVSGRAPTRTELVQLLEKHKAE